MVMMLVTVMVMIKMISDCFEELLQARHPALPVRSPSGICLASSLRSARVVLRTGSAEVEVLQGGVRHKSGRVRNKRISGLRAL